GQKNAGYQLLQKFKLHLRRGEPSPEGPLWRAGRHTYPVVDLVADYLRRIKDMALADVRKGATTLFDERRVLWCLTVPAIWRDDEKAWMRLAARKAGLIDGSAADACRLCLVLEPEAALYCQRVDSQAGTSRLEPGVCFMVVDAGGGTVDLTAHLVGE